MNHEELIGRPLCCLVEYLRGEYSYALDYYMVVIDNKICLKLSKIKDEERYTSMKIINYQRCSNGYMYWLDVE